MIGNIIFWVIFWVVLAGGALSVWWMLYGKRSFRPLD
jgi:hypothetical protein